MLKIRDNDRFKSIHFLDVVVFSPQPRSIIYHSCTHTYTHLLNAAQVHMYWEFCPNARKQSAVLPASKKNLAKHVECMKS